MKASGEREFVGSFLGAGVRGGSGQVIPKVFREEIRGTLFRLLLNSKQQVAEKSAAGQLQSGNHQETASDSGDGREAGPTAEPESQGRAA